MVVRIFSCPLLSTFLQIESTIRICFPKTDFHRFKKRHLIVTNAVDWKRVPILPMIFYFGIAFWSGKITKGRGLQFDMIDWQKLLNFAHKLLHLSNYCTMHDANLRGVSSRIHPGIDNKTFACSSVEIFNAQWSEFWLQYNVATWEIWNQNVS